MKKSQLGAQGSWSVAQNACREEAVRERASDAEVFAFHLARGEERLAELRGEAERASAESAVYARTSARLAPLGALMFVALPLALIARPLAYTSAPLAVSLLVVAVALTIVGAALAVRVAVQHRAAVKALPQLIATDRRQTP